MKLTVEMLERADACEDGIKFFKRNKLEGFPMGLIGEVIGDYNEYVYWVKSHRSLEILETRSPMQTAMLRGQCLVESLKKSDNDVKYDPNGNVIFQRYSDGSIVEYEYDENGNMLKVKYGNYIAECEYDKIGNETSYKNSFGSLIERGYKYYEDGQLEAVYENGEKILEIPFFEK